MNILFYKKSVNRNFSIHDRLGIGKIPEILPSGTQFHISDNPELLRNADVVIWDIPFSRHIYVKQPKPAGQIWVGWLLESTANYPWIPGVMALFDLTMTYRMDSDIPIPFFTPDFLGEFRKAPEEKTKGVCSFISSPANQSRRLQLLTELCEYIPVDKYGNRDNFLRINRSYKTKLSVSAQYHFCLAFENAVSDGYVTEKLYDALLAGSVPVYLGATDIEEYLPGDNCCIHANHCTARELAQLLQAYINDPALYNTLHAWRQQPFRQGFMAKMEPLGRHFILRLLDKTNETIWKKTTR